jgi:hypothetical protein
MQVNVGLGGVLHLGGKKNLSENFISLLLLLIIKKIRKINIYLAHNKLAALYFFLTLSLSASPNKLAAPRFA